MTRGTLTHPKRLPQRWRQNQRQQGGERKQKRHVAVMYAAGPRWVGGGMQEEGQVRVTGWAGRCQCWKGVAGTRLYSYYYYFPVRHICRHAGVG